METRIEIYEDSVGEWRWNLVHRNGNIMADSSEGYKTKAGVIKALENVRKYMSSKEVASVEV